MIALVAALACQSGCAHGPKRFSKIDSVSAFDRARAVGLSARQPDATALPALVGRLGDSDPVVRLAAHEELRKRTGQDFGYVPWASADERTGAVERWQAWLAQRADWRCRRAFAPARVDRGPETRGAADQSDSRERSSICADERVFVIGSRSCHR